MLHSLTQANVKALRENILLKKNYQWILIAAIAILLLLLFLILWSASKRDAAKNAQIAALISKSRNDSSTIVYFQGANGTLVASNEAIVANSRRMMQRVVDWDSIARQFRVPSKEVSQVITERTKTDVVIKQDSDAVVVRTLDNTAFPDINKGKPWPLIKTLLPESEIRSLQYTFKNPWFIADTKIGVTKQDSGYIKLQAWDTLSAVETTGKDGIHLKINHSNPFIKTTGMNDYRVQAPTGRRPYNVSVSTGYGLVPNQTFKGVPFIGITVGKTIFTFGKRKP